MSFNEILGQAGPISILRRSALRGRLAHAYLFVGPDGVGKKLTALALAKALNCRALATPPGPDAPEEAFEACGVCPACRKIDLGNHPDVRLVEPQAKEGSRQAYIHIDVLREVQKSLQYAPLEGRRKVVILDGADRMQPASANAVLKTLEEPPPETLIVLVTGEERSLLPTIVSRCQLVRFRGLSPENLGRILARRGCEADAAEAGLLASLSGGSPGRAAALIEEGILAERETALDCAARAESLEAGEIFALAEDYRTGGKDPELFLDVLASWSRDILRRACLGEEAHPANSDRVGEIDEAARKLTLMELVGRLETVEAVRAALRGNANRQLAVERLLLKLSGRGAA